ncbi:hypothetical protein [Streptomyces sp. NPDC051162]|uniref:hypothetical protein n=1 Tax=Streptomyces sp. NPDC051162 TaxID=3154747 RepID=UPI003419214A
MSFFAPSAPSKYIKFTNPGDSVQGYVEEVSDPFPVKEYKTEKPKLDSKGNPVMQVRMILATPDSQGEGDDGRRSLYVSGWRMTTAIGDAMRRAGETAEAPKPGAYLKLTFARLGQASGGMAPPKVYVAEYTKAPAAPAGAVAHLDQESAAALRTGEVDTATPWGPPPQSTSPAPW